MRFRDDTRGVTVQVGAVLLFATIIIALSVYQATVVPSENADVEYRHSQQVQGQLVDVRNALVATAETGNARPATVSLGTEYPNRVFLVNPPPPAGTLKTVNYENDSDIRLSNVVATDDETADFLDFTASDPWTVPTKALSYVPGYNEYRDAPQIRYEASLLSNYYPEQDTSVPVADQLLADGETRTISLVALNGSVGTSRSTSTAVDPTSLSTSQRVQVEPKTTGEPVNISLPTAVDANVLRNSTSLGDTDGVDVLPASGNRVYVHVDWTEPFTLRTAKVGVGSDATSPPTQYLTLVESDDDSVTVEARDEYNNPEPGVAVEVDGSNPFDEASKRTGVDGRATFEAEDGEDATTTLEILGGGSPEREVDVSVDTMTPAAGNGTGGNGSGAYVVDWLEGQSDAENPGLSCDGESCTLDASEQSSVPLSADSTPRVDGGTFTYEVQNQSVGEVDPVEGTTDDAGEGTTTFTANANGTTYAYVSGGGSGDRVELTVENYGSGASGTPQVSARVDDLTRTSTDEPVLIGSYSVSNTNSSFERVDINFQNLDDASASQTMRRTLTQAGVTYSNNYGSDQSYEVVFEVIYDDGNGEYVAGSKTVSDEADALNPASQNDDLGTSGTAAFTSWSIEDQTQVSNDQPRWEYSYEVSGTGSFSNVTAYALNVPGGGSRTLVFDSRSQNNQNIQFNNGAGDEYRVGLLVRDANGAVVDIVRIADEADGNGTYSGP